MRRLTILFLALMGVLLAIQLIRPDRTNPPLTGAVTAPPEVLAVLQRACFDCHSNTTRWPWYSEVAPVSWFVAHHVHEGRDELNFSQWAEYPPTKRAHKLEEIEELVRADEMPTSDYLLLHGDAKLSDADRELLYAWVKHASTE